MRGQQRLPWRQLRVERVCDICTNGDTNCSSNPGSADLFSDGVPDPLPYGNVADGISDTVPDPASGVHGDCIYKHTRTLGNDDFANDSSVNNPDVPFVFANGISHFLVLHGQREKRRRDRRCLWGIMRAL